MATLETKIAAAITESSKRKKVSEEEEKDKENAILKGGMILSLDESLQHKGLILLEDNQTNSPLMCKKALLDVGCSDFEGDIFLIINSGGGELFEFLSLHDTILFIRKFFDRNVITLVKGIAASGAALVLQAGSVRVATKNSYVMLHEMISGSEGNTSSMEYDTKITKKLQKTIFKIWADSMGVSVTELNEIIDAKDRYFTAREAKKVGLIDNVVGF